MRIAENLDAGSENSCARELVSAKAKRALVGAGGRILFYPTLFYNVCRNKMEAEFRWWDEVDQFIYLGAVPFPKDVPHLQQLGVRGVITLNEPYETLVPSSLYKAHGIDHLVIPTRDYLFAPSLVDIIRAVDFIHRNASHGRITYVHCKAGRGRSTTIVLCYLVEYKHMTPTTALEYVRSRRPRVLLAPSQWQAVQEYSKRKQEFSTSQDPKPTNSLITDEALITVADIEGHGTASEDAINDLDLSFSRLSMPTSFFKEDEVLISEEDLEGYDTYADALKDTDLSQNGIAETEPMMKRISYLFTSLKFPKSGPSAASEPVKLRAC